MNQPTPENQDATVRMITELQIAQSGDPILGQVAEPFQLPFEAELAIEHLQTLFHAAQRLLGTGSFNNGIGLAAPQLGLARQAAVIIPPGQREPINLLNPTVVDASPELDIERYEGCLSFFGVSGRLARPLSVTVRHEGPGGVPNVTTFTRGVARLVAHELDHLAGRFYMDQMPSNGQLVPVDADPETRTVWIYEK